MTTETRERVIAAATEEFAEHGYAGARIDRIASNAHASKERLYAWFGDKSALYSLVVQRAFASNATAAPFDVDNLPDFSRRFYLSLVNNPTTLRLLIWEQVETHAPKVLGSEVGQQVTLARIAEIEAAQQAGTLGSRFNPYDLNAIIFTTVFAWASIPRSLAGDSPKEFERRGDVIAEAIALLIA